MDIAICTAFITKCIVWSTNHRIWYVNIALNKLLYGYVFMGYTSKHMQKKILMEYNTLQLTLYGIKFIIFSDGNFT